MNQEQRPRKKPRRWWVVTLLVGAVFVGVLAILGRIGVLKPDLLTATILVLMVAFVLYKIQGDPTSQRKWPQDNPGRGKSPIPAEFEEAKARELAPAKMPMKVWLWLAAALVPAIVIGVWNGNFEAALVIFFVLAVGSIFVITPYMKTVRELLGDAFVPSRIAVNDASFPAPDAALAPILDELEAVRKQAWLQANPSRPPRPTRWLLTGALLGFVLWLISLYEPGSTATQSQKIFGVVLWPAMGAGLAAFLWSISGRGKAIVAQVILDAAYGQLYKQRVLPQLAASFGHLAWRGVAQPPLDEFKRYHLFPHWDAARAENEIYGDYRGLPLSISELRLSARQDNGLAPVFAGLAVTLTLPRALRGVTVVTAGPESIFGHLLESLRAHAAQSLQPVHLEDPVFAQAFQVHATDQVSSRALLTPAFMERFKNLMNSFGDPALLAQDNRLFMALATQGRNLFQPPSYNESAAARARLAQLREDIATLLRVADAVIDLDSSTRQAAAPVGD